MINWPHFLTCALNICVFWIPKIITATLDRTKDSCELWCWTFEWVWWITSVHFMCYLCFEFEVRLLCFTSFRYISTWHFQLSFPEYQIHQKLNNFDTLFSTTISKFPKCFYLYFMPLPPSFQYFQRLNFVGKRVKWILFLWIFMLECHSFTAFPNKTTNFELYNIWNMENIIWIRISFLKEDFWLNSKSRINRVHVPLNEWIFLPLWSGNIRCTSNSFQLHHTFQDIYSFLTLFFESLNGR